MDKYSTKRGAIDRKQPYTYKNDHNCETCKKYKGQMAPTHNGSKYCNSGSIASGGTKAHCTCDVCF